MPPLHHLPFRAVAALLSGAALGMSFWAGSWGWLSWPAMVPFWWALRGATVKKGAALGWLFGCAAWGIGLPWLFPTVSKFVPGNVFVGAVVYALLLGFHATVFMALGAGARAGHFALRGFGWRPEAAFLASSVPTLVAVEGLWPRLFPFSFAESQTWHLPLVQTAALVGGAGPAAAVAFFSSCLYLAVRSRAGAAARDGRAARAMAGAALTAACVEAYGLVSVFDADAVIAAGRAEGRTLAVSVVQASIPTAVWNRPQEVGRARDVFRTLTGRAAADGARLVVWPQNSYWHPAYFGAQDRALEAPVDESGAPLAADPAIPRGVDVMFGTEARIVSSGGRLRRQYVAALRKADGSWGGASAKRFPTPFGEFIPGGLYLPWLYRLTPELVRIHGGRQRPLTLSDGTKVGPFICYDATRPASSGRLVLRGSEVLVELTSNAAFFDADQFPRQSLRSSVVRAVEARRFLLRAVSSGVSAVIEPSGRVSARIPFGAVGTLESEVVPLTEISWAVKAGPLVYRVCAVWSAGLVLLGILGRRRGGAG